MNIFYQRQTNKTLKDVDEYEDTFDDDLTTKQIQKLKEQRKAQEQNARLHDGTQPIKGEIPSGIQSDIQPYLLPHFTMCLVGKPGSGKSTLMKMMIEDDKYYKDKFDDILVISPSISKLEMDIPERNTHHEFDFDWIYDWIYKLNQRQLRYLQRTYMEQDQDQMQSKRNRKLQQKSTFVNSFNASHQPTTFPARSLQVQNNLSINQMVNELNRIYKNRQSQNMQNISTMIQMNQAETLGQVHKTALGFLQPAQLNKKRKQNETEYETKKHRNYRQKRKVDMIQTYADEIHKLFKGHAGTKQNMKESHKNILLLLDDVVGEINQYQHSYQLAKLFLNRRHLIANATVSIIVSTQKYTMIPARIRSTSNWMVLFRLNPVDFELARTDATSFQKKTWADILRFVFGQNLIEDNKDEQRHLNYISGDNGHEIDHNFISLHVNGNENRLFKQNKEFKFQ